MMMTIDEINDYLYHRQGYEDIKGAIHTMYVCFMDAVMYVLYTTRYLTSKVKMTEMYKRRV